MRRRAGLGAAAVAGLLALAGCTQPSNAPTEYNATTQSNFMAGCTGTYAGSGTTLAPSGTCECMYTVVTSNLSIQDFTTLNDNLKKDRNTAIPDNVKKGWEACPGYGAKAGSSTGGVSGPAAPSSPGTTAAATATTGTLR